MSCCVEKQCSKYLPSCCVVEDGFAHMLTCSHARRGLARFQPIPSISGFLIYSICLEHEPSSTSTGSPKEFAASCGEHNTKMAKEKERILASARLRTQGPEPVRCNSLCKDLRQQHFIPSVPQKYLRFLNCWREVDNQFEKLY